MAVTATPIFPQTIKNTVKTILPADTSAFVTAYTGGANGSKIESWYVSSTDTSTRDLQVSFTISAATNLITTINIPINSGNSTSIPVTNMLTSAQWPGLCRDSNGNPYLYIASGTTLQISCTTTVTAAKVITSIIQAGDY